jgi:FAD synthase
MNYKKQNKAPDTVRKFENQWRKISKKDNAQALMRSIRRKLRSIAEQGVFSVK